MHEINFDLEGEKKKLQIVSSDKDHARLRDLANDVGLEQGQVVHMLLELIDLVIDEEKKRGNYRVHSFNPESGYPAEIEFFIFWVIWKLGLANDQQFREVINLAAAYKSVPGMKRDALALMSGFYQVVQNSKAEPNAGATE